MITKARAAGQISPRYHNRAVWHSRSPAPDRLYTHFFGLEILEPLFQRLSSVKRFSDHDENLTTVALHSLLTRVLTALIVLLLTIVLPWMLGTLNLHQLYVHVLGIVHTSRRSTMASRLFNIIRKRSGQRGLSSPSGLLLCIACWELSGLPSLDLHVIVLV